MIRYHDFNTKEEAESFLTRLRANGGTGYVLSYNENHHQVREIV